jgi:hypothetical protein
VYLKVEGRESRVKVESKVESKKSRVESKKSRVESKKSRVESKKSRVKSRESANVIRNNKSQNIFNTMYNRSVTTADHSRTGGGGGIPAPQSK